MKKPAKQSVVVDIKIVDLIEAIWKGNITLPANKIYQLIIEYPFNQIIVNPIKTGKNGMGLLQLLKKIGQIYDDVYENAYSFHNIDDLYLEGITVDHKKKTIKLDVGS
jgi:hypothetical protein